MNLSKNEAFLNLEGKAFGLRAGVTSGRSRRALDRMTGNVHQLIHERDWAICMVVARLSHGPKAVSIAGWDGTEQRNEPLLSEAG